MDSCGDDHKDNPADAGENSITEIELPDDMVLIGAKGQSTILGTNDEDAKANERPAMKVNFTYDYFMGESEYMSDGSPLTAITFYDAILIANKRSIAEKFDTAYSYTDVTFLNGHCVSMEGFQFHPDKNAYRLPTEAEWIYAYQLDGKSGVQKNDGVMEWVNDWKGNLKDTTLYNFVGASDASTLGERIVKGGRTAEFKVYSRGDTYTINSSTRTKYLGFRLAFGAIPSPTWLDPQGNATSNPTVIKANPSDLKRIAGTTRIKLVYRNDATGNLGYVDFTASAGGTNQNSAGSTVQNSAGGTSGLSAGGYVAVEIQDSLPVFHPEISPDGRRVAFCTKPEGTPGKSELYVRTLESSNATPVKLQVESAAIPRWRVSANGDTTIVYVTSAAAVNSEKELKEGSTWEVPFNDGKFGTPRKLFDGAYHGGISNSNQLAVTGARQLRARMVQSEKQNSSAKDALWYNGEQACNVSLAKDSSKRTLFLDFGSETGIKFAGHDYDVHEEILIVDSTGKLVQSVGAPAGYSYDHTEWAFGNVAVATLANVNGAHQKIVLVNLTDSSIVTLAEGEELWHPGVWRDENYNNEDSGNSSQDFEGLHPDSAGIYYQPGASEAAAILRYKMELLWNYRQANLVILGSSRSQYSIDPRRLDSTFTAVNLSNVPNSLFCSNYIFKNYLLNHYKNLKYIVISVDFDMWWRDANDPYDNFFSYEYALYPGYVYDANHNFWKGGYPEGLYERAHEGPTWPKEYLKQHYENTFLPTQGFQEMADGSWGTNPSVDYDSTWIDTKFALYQANFNELETIVTEAEEKDITVIGIIFPQSPAYKNTGSFGCYGPRRSEAPIIIQNISKISERHPNFILLDENKMGDHDYPDEMAHDKDHLGYTGSIEFTQRLQNFLKTLE